MIGAPSLARLLEQSGVDVTLVDRQPHCEVTQHVQRDALTFTSSRRYRVAVIDPPWHLNDIENWLLVAANAVGVGGIIYTSIWPPFTRPTAQSEISALIKSTATWSHIKYEAENLYYAMPYFEYVARQKSPSQELSRSPLIGHLMRLDVKALPPLKSFKRNVESWNRFIINTYQIAVRRAISPGPIGIQEVPGSSGWYWPYVSSRAPNIDKIGIWSSSNEVAACGSLEAVQHALRTFKTTTDADEFKRTLRDLPDLLGWDIPRPPYWRTTEWSH